MYREVIIGTRYRLQLLTAHHLTMLIPIRTLEETGSQLATRNSQLAIRNSQLTSGSSPNTLVELVLLRPGDKASTVQLVRLRLTLSPIISKLS